MYRKYYSYNDMPEPIKPSKPINIPKPQPPKLEKQKEIIPEPQKKNPNFLSRFEKDDLILAAVLLVLLMDECDDWLLIAVIGGLLFFNK